MTGYGHRDSTKEKVTLRLAKAEEEGLLEIVRQKVVEADKTFL